MLMQTWTCFQHFLNCEKSNRKNVASDINLCLLSFINYIKHKAKLIKKMCLEVTQIADKNPLLVQLHLIIV